VVRKCKWREGGRKEVDELVVEGGAVEGVRGLSLLPFTLIFRINVFPYTHIYVEPFYFQRL